MMHLGAKPEYCSIAKLLLKQNTRLQPLSVLETDKGFSGILGY